MSAVKSENATNDREIQITRTINAPRDKVFALWTDAKHLPHWWGRNGFTVSTEQHQVKQGGTWKFTLHGPGGQTFPNRIVYDEVAAPSVLTTSNYSDRPEPDFRTLMSFQDDGAQTRVTMRLVFPTAAARDESLNQGAVESGNETFDRFVEQLPLMQDPELEFVITRTFKAPRDLVFQIYSKQAHLEKWWGPAGLEMKATKLDFRRDGIFHYGMKAPNGMEMWGKFVYRQIAAPRLISFISSFSNADGGTERHFMSATWPLETLCFVEFIEAGAQTTLKLSSFPINANEVERKTFKEGKASMQQGFAGTLDQMQNYLVEIQK